MGRGALVFALVVAAISLSGAQQPSQGAAHRANDGDIQETPSYAPYSPLSSDPCYRAKNHDTADLCAQWRAAFAAEESARAAHQAVVWTIVGTTLSGIALLALICTLLQTEKALREARRGNEISEGVGKLQLRAYLVPERFRIKAFHEGTAPVVAFKIANVGQTPARDVRLVTKCFVSDSTAKISAETVRFGNAPEVISRTQLGAGSASSEITFALLPDGKFTPQIEASIRSGEIIVGVFGAVSYRDVFKKRHLVTFKMFMPPDYLARGEKRMVACSKGNHGN